MMRNKGFLLIFASLTLAQNLCGSSYLPGDVTFATSGPIARSSHLVAYLSGPVQTSQASVIHPEPETSQPGRPDTSQATGPQTSQLTQPESSQRTWPQTSQLTQPESSHTWPEAGQPTQPVYSSNYTKRYPTSFATIGPPYNATVTSLTLPATYAQLTPTQVGESSTTRTSEANVEPTPPAYHWRARDINNTLYSVQKADNNATNSSVVMLVPLTKAREEMRSYVRGDTVLFHDSVLRLLEPYDNYVTRTYLADSAGSARTDTRQHSSSH